ncbi:MAG TPA: Asp-tRNA(Asn)/Glu-tRNA(Gln) amidotransferase subunit GatC [Candidatus Deferrimicrobium sp.]|nr:Asp-tRNA(Asn)/Glu-tRNA(Gln) amidotransferase subunit GatC [Candidatus Deferrimicrobium sp.]
MKTGITKEQVEHIAWLAHIKVSDDEKEKFTNLFNDILEYFQKIDEVDTSDVEYTFHGVQIKNVLREDVVCPSLSKEDAFKNVPKKDKDFIKAPRMV